MRAQQGPAHHMQRLFRHDFAAEKNGLHAKTATVLVWWAPANNTVLCLNKASAAKVLSTAGRGTCANASKAVPVVADSQKDSCAASLSIVLIS